MTDTPTRQPVAGTAPPMNGDPLWAQDFPINRVEELDNSRRQFLKFLGLTSLAFFTGTLATAIKALVEQQRESILPRVRLAAPGDVPEGAWHHFYYPDERYPGILIHLPDGQYVAYDQKCTHLMCPVIYQAEAARIYCPCHEGEFDPANGRNLSGPPPRPLNRIRLDVAADGIYAVGREV